MKFEISEVDSEDVAGARAGVTGPEGCPLAAPVDIEKLGVCIK